MISLELPECRLRAWAKNAVDGDFQVALNLPHQITAGAAPQCWPAISINVRYDDRFGRGTRQDARNLVAKLDHVEWRVVLPAVGQRILLVPAAHDGVCADFLENGCHPPPVGIQLYRGPGIIGAAGVLGLNANEVRVSRAEALPHTPTGVIAPAGRDYEEGAVASKTELRQRTGQIRSSVRDDTEARHDALRRSRRVVAHHALDGTHLAASACAPARLFRHLETSVLQHFREPS